MKTRSPRTRLGAEQAWWTKRSARSKGGIKAVGRPLSSEGAGALGKKNDRIGYISLTLDEKLRPT